MGMKPRTVAGFIEVVDGWKTNDGRSANDLSCIVLRSGRRMSEGESRRWRIVAKGGTDSARVSLPLSAMVAFPRLATFECARDAGVLSPPSPRRRWAAAPVCVTGMGAGPRGPGRGLSQDRNQTPKPTTPISQTQPLGPRGFRFEDPSSFGLMKAGLIGELLSPALFFGLGRASG